MRYPLHKQIKEILKTVIEALEYVQQNRDVEVATQLLTDGNAAVEQISKKIIEHESSIENREVFNLCSFLLETFPNAQHKLEYLSDFDDIDPLINATKELLQEVDASIPYKISVVFFAELGQKWDAMNSLYEAFKEREDCDVEVVLTPILRQVQDGNTVKKDVIYEDYLTDLGIEFTPYERYDISLDPPDMAFISNPYESVTVPQFWPENIAEHTKLVYVPYYTNMSLNGNTIKSESKLPFINQSWKIITQSEEVKLAYKKYSLSNKNNFLVSGLPKWDELFETMDKEKYRISDWEKLGEKTIFLWNTHYSIGSPISTLIENGKDIIQIFKGQGNAALIFRPHPMTETILRLHHPEYLPLWNEIKKEIQLSKNIVLDNHSSYKAAFAHSDALLSEYSSILTEYAFLKKPILWLKKGQTDDYLCGVDLPNYLMKFEAAYTTVQIEQFINEVTQDPVHKRNSMNELTQGLPIIDGRNGKYIAKELIANFQEGAE